VRDVAIVLLVSLGVGLCIHMPGKEDPLERENKEFTILKIKMEKGETFYVRDQMPSARGLLRPCLCPRKQGKREQLGFPEKKIEDYHRRWSCPVR